MRQRAIPKVTSEFLAYVPVWRVPGSPFSRGGPNFGGNDLGFDFGPVTVFLKQPGLCFILSGCEGQHLPPDSFPFVAPFFLCSSVL